MADEAGSGAASPLARRLRWLQDRLWSITIVVLVGIGVLIAIGYTISLRLDDARSAQTDNTTWLVAQTEVELLKLDIVLGTTRPQAALTPLREAVDIYLSRIATVDRYMARAPVLGVLQGGDDWQRVLEGSERLRRLIDVPDALLAMNLPAARHETAALRRPMRQFALQALALQIEAATRSRESLADLLTGSALVGITLILLLLSTAWMLRSLGDRLRLRHAEAARARSNLESLLAATGDGVIVIGPGGHVRGVNAAATRLLGRPDSAVIGQPVARLLALPAGGLREGALDPAGMGIDAPDERRVEVGVLLPDGTERPTELVIAAGQDTDGAPLRFLFLQDVSEQRRHETSLRAARDAAVQAAEAKTRFLAMMSHEMRTPLNGVIAALDILMRTARPNRKQQRFLEIAERAAASALDQVNDVLELARLGDDSVLEAATDFDMAALLRDLAEEMAPLAARHGNSITVEAPDLAGVWLHGPRRSLKRVLTNLVGNAAKFTQNGAITLRAGLAGGARDQMLTVEVVDTGAGIAADRLETIFDPFERLETGYDRATEGTGLGLGIARRMVERMGGTLGVSSAPGQGSVFRFAVPLPPGTPVAPGDRAPLPDEGVLPAQEILIVEDNPTNRLVLREMLRHLGQNVTEAADGAEAVALARLYPFDLILMDISMPGMDGLTATRAIRAGGPRVRRASSP
ncbi:hybrid sensor histidine kinase/response regulator [Gemmobacter caeruleus]|uniref:hybrid sensor histidine kinase/response regulator n=1 Tax=Gemmobacter caeruleus TaxID=2595004 RepID=UPI0011EBCDC6|nr:ATP-binding protein [Gemmobacter caeruleus]